MCLQVTEGVYSDGGRWGIWKVGYGSRDEPKDKTIEMIMTKEKFSFPK